MAEVYCFVSNCLGTEILLMIRMFQQSLVLLNEFASDTVGSSVLVPTCAHLQLQSAQSLA